eukprot:1774726-Prymnesium_polylepis.1
MPLSEVATSGADFSRLSTGRLSPSVAAQTLGASYMMMPSTSRARSLTNWRVRSVCHALPAPASAACITSSYTLAV